MHKLHPDANRVQINSHHLERRSKFAPGCKLLKHRSHGQKYTRGAVPPSANCAYEHSLDGSGTPRPKTISARDSSAQTIRPIFQSGTARHTLVGPLGPFFFFFFFFWGGGGGYISLFCLCALKTRLKKHFNRDINLQKYM